MPKFCAQTVKLMGGIRSLGVVDDKLVAALSDESPRVRMFAALELGNADRWRSMR